MFREMRREKQLLSEAETVEILQSCTSGVLSEKKYALECLVEKYSPDYLPEGKSVIERNWDKVCVAEVQVEHMTGKAAIEIVNNKV